MQDPESFNKRRVNAYCLASSRYWDWRMSEDDKKKRDRKIVEVKIGLFISCDQI